jgi:hypothetical protein
LIQYRSERLLNASQKSYLLSRLTRNEMNNLNTGHENYESIQSVAHLLDMDEVNMFCRLERKLEIKLQVVRNFRQDIEWVLEWIIARKWYLRCAEENICSV